MQATQSSHADNKRAIKRKVGNKRETIDSNIRAAVSVKNFLKTSFGPNGMDKMSVSESGEIIVTKDGRTILENIHIQNPVAKMMYEVAKGQDQEMGDGTIAVVLLTGGLLEQALELIKKGFHPSHVIRGYELAANKALQLLEDKSIPIQPTNKDIIKKVIITSLASKIEKYHEYLAEIAASAALKVINFGEKVKIDLDDIRVERRVGRGLQQTELVDGFICGFSEIAHPNMPKRVEDSKVILLNQWLRIEPMKFDGTRNTVKYEIEDPEKIRSFISREKEIIKGTAAKIFATGAKVVLNQQNIDEPIQELLAKKGILAVRRIKKWYMDRLPKVIGGKVINNLDDLTEEDLGYTKLIEEKKIADEKTIFIKGGRDVKVANILIRGGSKTFIDETDRSIHDALCAARLVIEHPRVIAGGGSTEISIAKELEKYAINFQGKKQIVIENFSRALQVAPIALIENAGLDPLNIISEIKTHQQEEMVEAGIDLRSRRVKNMLKMNILEPHILKKQIIRSATETANMILRIDDVYVKNRKSKGYG